MMGMRLTITDDKENTLFYGSKLVGYVESETLSCLKYLWEVRMNELGFKSFEEFAVYMEDAPFMEKVCNLSIEELTAFLERYDEDLKKHGREYTISEEALNQIPSDVASVWLEWW